MVFGEEAMTDEDNLALAFSEIYEKNFLAQVFIFLFPHIFFLFLSFLLISTPLLFYLPTPSPSPSLPSSQGAYENRNLAKSIALGWEVLRHFPFDSLRYFLLAQGFCYSQYNAPVVEKVFYFDLFCF